MLEAMLFAAREPLTTPDLADRLPAGVDVPALLADLAAAYEGAGVQLVESGRGYAFRTAPDLAFLFERETEEERKLSRAALETLAIVAYHQPVSRAEIEEIRGVTVSKGTLDLLMEIGWVRIKGRRRAPGRPAVYGTSEEFLTHFGLASAEELPGLAELKAAGLLEALPPEGVLPGPSDEELDPPDPEDLEGGYGAVFETDPEGDEDDADALAEAAANDDAVADEEDAPPRAANER
ncbi:MAG: SMC-Scp complex subunit ScpB [Alphaproteobacteria bacterium]|nr:SMC-Scp complex subunit ScpB [Alphaproteobacteria bacterium]